MWWKGDSETRYKYLYSPTEINELSEKVRSAANKTSLLFAFFNIHWQRCAPRNAVLLLKALKLPYMPILLTHKLSYCDVYLCVIDYGSTGVG